MKITVSRREFADALKVTQKAVAVKPSMPILAGIYLKVEGSTLELQSTDFTVGIISKVAAVIEEGGEIVLGGKTLFEMVQKLSGETVTITHKQDATAEIKSAGTKYSLLAMSADDFPKIQREDNLQTFYLRQAELKNLITKSAFAAAKNEESRPTFTGVLFHFSGEKLTVAATNTHRIATLSTTLETPFDGEKKYLVPAKTLQEISAMLDDSGRVEISFSEKQANFNFNNIFVTTRLISGDFPPFDRLFNEEKTIFVEVNAQDFLQAIERVAVIAKVADYEVVKLNFADNEIKISATSPGVGNAEEVVQAEIEGGELQISFNHNYLVDALKVAGDKVKIGLSESLKPVTCQFADFQYIVTPVRTKD